jgi:hypothetical protein
MDAISVAALATAFTKVMGLANEGKTADVQRDLIELQRQVMKVIADSDGLLQENKDLRERLRLSGELERRPGEGGVLWHVGAKDPGPYCTVCWDTKKLAVRVTVDNAAAICHECQEAYAIDDETRKKYGLPAIYYGSSITADRSAYGRMR